MRIDECGRYYLTEEEKERMIQKARGRSLAEKNPELAEQWNYEKNGDLRPEMVTYGSTLQVWWKYPYFDENTGKFFIFEWAASPNSRAKATGCPFLTNQRVWPGYNDLATNSKELLQQWNYKRNGNLRPTEITIKSNKKVWWVYPYDDPVTGEHFDFEWMASPNNRIKNITCPFLSSSNCKVWKGFNDLCTLNYSLSTEWHPTKNGKLKPTDVTPNCNKTVWWIYYERDSVTHQIIEVYEWRAKISDRNRGNGCPYLQKSKGEICVEEILNKHSIPFFAEYKIRTAKRRSSLRLDFYLQDCQIAIEFDGCQHFQDKKKIYKQYQFPEIVRRDNEKTKYCNEQSIALLRIPYVYNPRNNTSRIKIEQFILVFIQTKQVPQEIIDFYSQFPFSDYGKLLQKQNS